jgi:hypothetical protein
VRHVDIRKKRPSRWPWAVGVVALGLIVWGVTALLAPPRERQVPETETPADTQPPAALPLANQRARAIGSGTLEGLAPLGLEDRGMALSVDAEVLAGDDAGYWLLAAGRVIRFETSMSLEEGDSVRARGILRRFDRREAERMAHDALGRRPRTGEWSLVADLKLTAVGGFGPAVLPASRP